MSPTNATLAAILHDLREAGARITPLGIIARATDVGLPDDQIAVIVTQIAAGLVEVAA